MAMRAKPGKIRIIGGAWRGRKLSVPALPGLRPTADRTRETLFNWLQGHIQQARCLDLFAGTGALGFEALSRGAETVQFVEVHPEAATRIQSNIELLGARARVARDNALNWLGQKQTDPFHLVFIDPPFAAGLWQEAVNILEHSSQLAPGALVYLEMPRDTHIDIPTRWKLYKTTTRAEVCVSLYQIYIQPEEGTQ